MTRPHCRGLKATMTTAKRWRRRYRIGTCQDCGRTRRVTIVRFWVNYMRYVLCGECVRAYRGKLLTGTTD